MTSGWGVLLLVAALAAMAGLLWLEVWLCDCVDDMDGAEQSQHEVGP